MRTNHNASNRTAHDTASSTAQGTGPGSAPRTAPGTAPSPVQRTISSSCAKARCARSKQLFGKGLTSTRISAHARTLSGFELIAWRLYWAIQAERAEFGNRANRAIARSSVRCISRLFHAAELDLDPLSFAAIVRPRRVVLRRWCERSPTRYLEYFLFDVGRIEMNRLTKLALLAMLGLGIAGFARFVLAQSPGQQPPASSPYTLPPGSPPPVSLPGGPSLPSAPLPNGPSLPSAPLPTVPLPNAPLPATPSVGAPAPEGLKPLDVSPVLPTLPKQNAPASIHNELSKPVMPKVDLPKTDLPKVDGPSAPIKNEFPPTPAAQVDVGSARIERDGHPQNEDNPTGRQEPAVSVEWIGPPAAKVNQPADYSLVVRNVCNLGVSQVIVRVRVAEGVTVVATEPKALQEGNVLMWEVGNLLPKQERNLMLKLTCASKGDINCQAWVTFTGATAMTIRVREPKLMIKATAPEKVLVNDACTFLLTVSNPGDHPADQVKIHANLSEGLEHARGRGIDYDIGSLAAGETRSVQVICAAKSGGEQVCDATAEAEGGLKAADKAAVNVIMPRIDLEVAGPKLRYLDRKATYTIKVANPGDAPAANVAVNVLVPAGFKFMTADNGGRHDFSTRTVQWFLGEVGPGQSR